MASRCSEESVTSEVLGGVTSHVVSKSSLGARPLS